MKRLLVFALALMLLLNCFATALAESTIDFSGYTLDELMDIKTQLDEEIASRPGGEKMVLTPGQYKIGEDIPAGAYTFKFIQNGDSDYDFSKCYIYENESMYEYDVERSWLGDLPRDEILIEGDGENRVTLYPGEYMRLMYNGVEVVRIGNTPARDNSYVVPEGTTIPKGEYTVGVEIPSGTYNIYYNGTDTSRVRVFQDAKEADNMFNEGKETILRQSNTEGYVTLAEGNIVRVEYAPIIMKKAEAFTFD